MRAILLGAFALTACATGNDAGSESSTEADPSTRATDPAPSGSDPRRETPSASAPVNSSPATNSERSDPAPAPESTCADWTSNSADDQGQVGHTNRTGGGRPPYFNSTHAVGCAESSENYVDGTVTQGGGRGSVYCFRVN
jgi:hypothetical protein